MSTETPKRKTPAGLLAAVSIIGMSVGMVAAEAADNGNQGILIGMSQQHKASTQIKQNSSQIKLDSQQWKSDSQQWKNDSMQHKGNSMQMKGQSHELNPQPEPPG
jgi:hypothetical protein